MITAIIFIVVLAVLIFVHELGHFLIARAFKIRVDAFKIGFGPRILSWKRGETEYGLNLIPFGGYVKIFGENPDEESMSGPDANRSFVNKPRWQQTLVLFAGVFFNFLFAWILYAGLFVFGSNVPIDAFGDYSNYISNQRVIVMDAQDASPAAKAGIQIGDVIQSITSNEQRIEVKNTADIQRVINSSLGNPITIQYIKSGNEKTVEVSPITGLVAGKYAIGIVMDRVGYIKMPFLTAMIEAPRYTIITIKNTAVGLYAFVTGIFQYTASFDDVAGPVGIAIIIKNAFELGFAYLIIITAIISINLGIINLIPFPALDGGRILFVGIEGIIRRRIPAKFFNIVNTVGFVLLMILMVIVTYKDIAKLFG